MRIMLEEKCVLPCITPLTPLTGSNALPLSCSLSTTSFVQDAKPPPGLVGSSNHLAPERPMELVDLRRISVQTRVSVVPMASTSIHDIQPTPKGKRGLTFWLVFASNLLVEMLSALDLVRPPVPMMSL